MMFTSLRRYGYETEQCEYLIWRRKLEQHVLKVQDNALFPLLHFVLDDLPTSTKAPELNDKHARAILASQQQPDSVTVDANLIGLYLAWLVKAGFLPPPSRAGDSVEALPSLPEGNVKAVGRSGA